MSVTLERKQVIELLDKLGSDQDEDALAAARMLHKQISGSGMSWDDLLVGDSPEVEKKAPVDTLPSEGDENNGHEIKTAGSDSEFTGDETQTLLLIEELLGRDGISSEFREELEEYKTDSADGIFDASDHRYVHAVYARLTKNWKYWNGRRQRSAIVPYRYLILKNGDRRINHQAPVLF